MALLAKERVSRPEPAPSRGGLPFSTLPELYRFVAATYDRPDALNYPRGEGWESFSHRRLSALARRLALGLADLGVRKGESVGLLTTASPMWVAVDLAIQSAQGVTVPIFKRISPESFAHEIRDSGMRYLFIGNPDELPMARAHAGPGVTIVELRETSGDGQLGRILAAGDALDRSDPGLSERLCAGVHEEDLATIIYTSGSTGLPKGVRCMRSGGTACIASRLTGSQPLMASRTRADSSATFRSSADGERGGSLPDP